MNAKRESSQIDARESRERSRAAACASRAIATLIIMTRIKLFTSLDEQIILWGNSFVANFFARERFQWMSSKLRHHSNWAKGDRAATGRHIGLNRGRAYLGWPPRRGAFNCSLTMESLVWLVALDGHALRCGCHWSSASSSSSSRPGLILSKSWSSTRKNLVFIAIRLAFWMLRSRNDAHISDCFRLQLSDAR